MLIRRLAIENVRSFLEKREILFDGQISILIGPNGGGKTNLLDTLVIMLRRYIFKSPYYTHSPTPDEPDLWVEQYNSNLNQLIFQKNSKALKADQIVELEIEITREDIENMGLIKSEAEQVRQAQRRRFHVDPWRGVSEWDLSRIVPGARLIVVCRNGNIEALEYEWQKHFLHYLHVFEADNYFRSEVGMTALRLPMVYLPVNRAANGFNSTVGLSGFNDYEQKRSVDAVYSRNASNLIPLAIGRLAKKYRLLQEDSNVNVNERFYSDQNLIEMTMDLKDLEYKWELMTVDPLTNTYDVKLEKQGSSFLVSEASSGERELLTYIFAIYALNVRNALVIVDEPELHLHPRWQSKLFSLFEKLAKSTGNQFILATHSPTFISPVSIQYVSRVFSENQRSDIVRLNSNELPNAKHLFNVVNSQNNERLFFAEKVVLVEGVSDRIFFERVCEIVAKDYPQSSSLALEFVSVGGKGLFSTYQKLMNACKVKFCSIADLDFIQQVGTAEIKHLFSTNFDSIKNDVIRNVKSMDGAKLAQAIEDALVSGDWSNAREVWEYIKGHRIRLKEKIGDVEKAALEEFVSHKEQDGLFILRRGSLEDYLPEQHRAKDIDHLIELVRSEDFWDRLPGSSRPEIERIAKKIMGINEANA